MKSPNPNLTPRSSSSSCLSVATGGSVGLGGGTAEAVGRGDCVISSGFSAGVSRCL